MYRKNSAAVNLSKMKAEATASKEKKKEKKSVFERIEKIQNVLNEHKKK